VAIVTQIRAMIAVCRYFNYSNEHVNLNTSVVLKLD